MSYDGHHIRFGQGGGITGLKTEYAIFDNGHCFKQTAGKDNFEYLVRLDKAFIDQTIDNIETLRLREMDINAPGDLYFFIELHEGEKLNRLVWGKSDVSTPETLKTFYRILYKSVKKDRK